MLEGGETTHPQCPLRQMATFSALRRLGRFERLCTTDRRRPHGGYALAVPGNMAKKCRFPNGKPRSAQKGKNPSSTGEGDVKTYHGSSAALNVPTSSLNAKVILRKKLIINKSNLWHNKLVAQVITKRSK